MQLAETKDCLRDQLISYICDFQQNIFCLGMEIMMYFVSRPEMKQQILNHFLH